MAEGYALTISAMLGAALLATAAVAAPITVTPVAAVAGKPLPLHIGGRVDRVVDGFRRQWPGTYFEAAFHGRGILFTVGPGDVVLTVSVDGVTVTRLVKPRPGSYRIDGLTSSRHSIRVAVSSESQAAPTVFGGFRTLPGTRALPAPARARQIEFIGDSHTVGYGNLATKRDCSEEEVWATTDTARGIAALTARRYGADYQVNAISGRGIVRNYDGGAGATLPTAYPFTLFDRATRYADSGWHPRLIAIALGTNDFTTALHAGEPWADRAALHADYEASYVAFVRRLRARDPDAHVLLWATDMANGEIAAEVAKVVARLKAAGERNVGFVVVTDLAFSGCHAHPSTADDDRIATTLANYIDGHPEIWAARRR
ncbi:SGNH/GDSL hydrolase family protein [Sphingomonas montana]|uniref:SGNH/GDSL hydrolase family protein n=1 Tax=Sphingomonas montana TaxID=1843236 RepID=UPI00096E0489|nr:SGNH/GDSL hydrolase family protein [Sphingomonas montana]